jgi:hypothetical protein
MIRFSLFFCSPVATFLQAPVPPPPPHSLLSSPAPRFASPAGVPCSLAGPALVTVDANSIHPDACASNSAQTPGRVVWCTRPAPLAFASARRGPLEPTGPRGGRRRVTGWPQGRNSDGGLDTTCTITFSAVRQRCAPPAPTATGLSSLTPSECAACCVGHCTTRAEATDRLTPTSAVLRVLIHCPIVRRDARSGATVPAAACIQRASTQTNWQPSCAECNHLSGCRCCACRCCGCSSLTMVAAEALFVWSKRKVSRERASVSVCVLRLCSSSSHVFDFASSIFSVCPHRQAGTRSRPTTMRDWQPDSLRVLMHSLSSTNAQRRWR